MPLLVLDGVTKYYGAELILDGVSLAIDRRERLGLIGANGTGKTTLLRIAAGELSPDEGQVVAARGASIAYLSQDPELDGTDTLWTDVMSLYTDLQGLEDRLNRLAVQMEQPQVRRDEDRMQQLLTEHAELHHRFETAGGYEYETTAKKVLSGLGLGEDHWHRSPASFSGGEKSRAALAKLLLSEPDLLLLDEPTNHLDIQGLEWLEEYLRSFPGAILVVAHDRSFLDRTTQRIVELEHHQLEEYRGNYSAYLKQKEQRLLTWQRTYERQQQDLQRQREIIRFLLGTGNEKRIRQARSREKLLEHIDVIDPPPAQRKKMQIAFTPRIRGGNEILDFVGVAKSFGGRSLFEDATFHIRRGQRVGLIGPNGSGKTTLLRIALGLERATAGRAALGRSVVVGYLEQEPTGLTDENQVIEELRELLPQFTAGEVRSLLARFLFFGDDVFKRVGDLSGGEKSRLLLAKLILQGPTFLVLDEPTNHLDIPSRQAVENALLQYQGTLLLVSHDRYLLDKVCRRLLILGDGRVRVHEGNFSHWRRWLRQQAEQAALQAEAERLTRAAAQREAQRRARRRKRPGESAVRGPAANPEELEQRVQDLERKIALIEQRLQTAAGADPRYVRGLSMQHALLSQQLTETLTRWEQALAEAEEA